MRLMSSHLLSALVVVLVLGSHGAHAIRLVENMSSSKSDEASWSPPWFCHSIDCPPFARVHAKDQGAEFRTYEAGIWISTNVSDVNYDTAVRTGFLRLFEYIAGANENGTKIEMTAPVRTELTPGAGPFCEDFFKVSFYMPYEYQSGAMTPPQPNRDTVFVDPMPASSFFVLSYSGFTSESKVLEKANELLGHLDDVGAIYDASTFFAASYDPPYRLINRHNEVWIPTENPEEVKTPALKVKDMDKGIVA